MNYEINPFAEFGTAIYALIVMVGSLYVIGSVNETKKKNSILYKIKEAWWWPILYLTSICILLIIIPSVRLRLYQLL